MLLGTEAEILNTVARLGQATKQRISKEIGFSLDYIYFLCQSLAKKGYLTFAKGRYSLARGGTRKLLSQEMLKTNRELLKEVVDEVAGGEISNKLGKTVKDIEIMTDFVFPVEDESSALKSNINKIGPNLEKEKFNIDESVELFKKFKREGVKDG